MAKTTPSLTGSKPLHIFKPGTHGAMTGQFLRFTESDLLATCAAYDPEKHEAPLVVGHPAHNIPAYGWVKSLAFSEGGIDATPAQVNTDFADMVAAGAFKKISASFYAPNSPSNPVPGVYYLRHVGFLGAQPPAVKGLRNPSFADAEEGVLTFSEWDDATNAGLWRNLREWFLTKFGAEEADRVLPSYEVRALELGAQDEIREAAVEAATAGAADATAPTPAFSEPQPPKEPTVSPEEKTALEAENKRLRAEVAASKAAVVHAANVAFCDDCTGVTPAYRAVNVEIADHLATMDTPLEFGEGEQKAPLLTHFKAFLKSLPPLVQFGEHATKDRAADANDGSVEFAAPDGYVIDGASLAQHQKALAHQKANGGSYLDAARAVA